MKNKLLIGCLLILSFILPSFAANNSILPKSRGGINTLVDEGILAVLGNQLTNSIVGIAIPEDDRGVISWRVLCTGTVVASNFVLTAGHCVANASYIGNGGFKYLIDKHSVFIVPWQINGIKSNIPDVPMELTEKYKVKRLYLPYDYNFMNNPGDPLLNLPTPNYINQDFALLELEKPLPKAYQPIELANSMKTENLYIAGYGGNENQQLKKDLKYKEVYYYREKLNSNAPDFKQIYTIGSERIPSYDNQGKLIFSACSYNEAGDDGGPILYRDPVSRKFTSLVGIYSNNYNGFAQSMFCAPLNDPIQANVSIVKNNNLIKSIIDDEQLPMATQCLSLSGICHSFVFTANMQGNSISQFKYSRVTNKLIPMGGNKAGLARPVLLLLNPGIASTDNYGEVTYLNKNHFLIALNENHEQYKGSLISFSVNSNTGALTPVQSIQTDNAPIAMTFSNDGNSIFVINENTLSTFSFNQKTGEIEPGQQLTFPKGLTHFVSIVVANGMHGDEYVYVTSAGNNKVFMFKYNKASKFLSTLSFISEHSRVEAGDLPSQIKMDPTGQYAIVTNAGDSSIWIYKVNNTSASYPYGFLELKEKHSSFSERPNRIIIVNRGDGLHADIYIGSEDSNYIVWFTLNYYGKTGESLLTKHTDYINSGKILDMSIDKTGRGLFLTLADGKNRIVRYERNAETGLIGTITHTQPTGYYPSAIAILE